MKVEDEKDDEKKVKASDDYMDAMPEMRLGSFLLCMYHGVVFFLTSDGFLYLPIAGDGVAPSIELPKLLVSLLPPGAVPPACGRICLSLQSTKYGTFNDYICGHQ